MLIYDNKGQIFTISKKALKLAGYGNIEEFNDNHKDYSELFVKKPGFIYNFENFSWVIFLKNAEKEKRKAQIKAKDGISYECELELEKLYPVEFDENTPEFYFLVEFKNVKVLESSNAISLDTPINDENMELELNDDGLNIPNDDNSFIKNEVEVNLSNEVDDKSKDDSLEISDISFNKNITTDIKKFDAKKESKSEFLIDEARHKEENNENIDLFKRDENGNKDIATPEIELKDVLFDNQKEKTSDFYDKTQPLDIETKDTAPIASIEKDIKQPDINKIASILGLPKSTINTFIIEMIDTFENETKMVIKNAEALNDLKKIKSVTIRLKGIASALQIETLFKLLEEILLIESMEEIIRKYDEVEIYFKELASMFKEDTATSEESSLKKEGFENEPSTSIESKNNQEQNQIFEFAQESNIEEKTSDISDEKKISSKTKLEEFYDGIDIDFSPNEAAEALGLPESLIVEFVNDFIKQAKDEKEFFENALDNQDIKSINKAAHKLKGVAANLRIEEMKDLMQKIQYAKTADEAKEYLSKFYIRLTSLNKELEKEHV